LEASATAFATEENNIGVGTGPATWDPLLVAVP